MTSTQESTPQPQPGHEWVVSADAGSRLESARRWLASLPRDGRVLLLAASGGAADELMHADASAHGTRFGVVRFTVDRLAARIAEPVMARRGLIPVTSLSLTAVVTRAVHRLLEAGALTRFAAVARRPGFAHPVVRPLEELRAM